MMQVLLRERIESVGRPWRIGPERERLPNAALHAALAEAFRDLERDAAERSRST